MVAALRARAERGDTGWACGRGDLACLSGPLRSSAACGELAAGAWHRLLSGVFKRYRRTRRACSVIVTRPGLLLVSTMDTVCGRPAQHSPDAHLVGHLNRISIIAGLIVCCWRLWLPGADPGEAEAAVTLGRVGLLWRSRVAALTDLGEACLTR